MHVNQVKFIAAAIGGGAIIAAAAVVTHADTRVQNQNVAGGSGDSATGTNYVQPTGKAMTLASTTTDAAVTMVETAAATMATSEASPTYKATAPKGFGS